GRSHQQSPCHGRRTVSASFLGCACGAGMAIRKIGTLRTGPGPRTIFVPQSLRAGGRAARTLPRMRSVRVYGGLESVWVPGLSLAWDTSAADALLRDGHSFRVRAIRGDDKPRLLDLFHRQGPETIHYRFFGAKPTLSDAELRYFTELDFDRHVGLAAVRGSGEAEEFLGVARYVRTETEAGGEPGRAEFAVAIADAEQGHGIGTILLEHLARIAFKSGILTLEADVLGDNRRMFEMLASSGFRLSGLGPRQIVHVSFPTGDGGNVLEASDQRSAGAAAASVRAFLAPRSVAVVGASRQGGSIGAAIVENLPRFRFHGPVPPGQHGGSGTRRERGLPQPRRGAVSPRSRDRRRPRARRRDRGRGLRPGRRPRGRRDLRRLRRGVRGRAGRAATAARHRTRVGHAPRGPQ